MQEQNAAAEAYTDSFSKWLALIVVIMGTFMAMLDSSIVNIAIPKMMSVFGVALDDVKWILTSYTLAMGSIVPLTAYLSDKWGSKKLYIFALGAFTLGSLLCGFAWSNTSMIIFRVIQALGGGMIMPVGMTMIMEIFPPNERGVALGFWGISSMAAPAIGPTLGGYIIQYLDWRLIFNVNIPIGIFAIIFAIILLKDTPTQEVKKFDMIGFITSAIGLICILYVLGEGANIDWENIKNPILITIGFFSLLLFVVHELTIPNPLLDLRIFKIYNFTLSQLITCVTTMALMGGTYVLPLFLQNIRGYTAMQTGETLFLSAIASGIMMPLSGALTDRFGPKAVTVTGLAILAFGSYKLCFLDMNTTREYIMWIAALRGVGMGLAMMPVNTTGMNDVDQPLMSKATSLSTVIRMVMSSVSITVMTTIITSRNSLNFARLSEQVTSFNQTASDIIKQVQGAYIQAGLSQADSISGAYSTIGSLIQGQAYVSAMNYALAVTSVTIVPAFVLVLMMNTKNIRKNINKAKQGKEVDMYGTEGTNAIVID